MRARLRQHCGGFCSRSAASPAAAPQARRLVGEVGLEPTKAKTADLQSEPPRFSHVLALTPLSAGSPKNPYATRESFGHRRTFVDIPTLSVHISVLTQC